MAGSLVSLFGSVGLAGATGHRATIPALLLGVMHHIGAATASAGEQPFFALSERFAWLADPVVMVILAVLAIVEIVAENNPDAPEFVNFALKAPKAIAGFVVVAATVGQVSDSVVLLAGSGLLGAGTALGVDSMRAEVKHAVHDASDGAAAKLAGHVETGWSALLTVLSVLVPVLAIAGLLVVAGIWFMRRRVAQAGRVPCPHCRELRHPDATVCPKCRTAISAPVAVSAGDATPAAK